MQKLSTEEFIRKSKLNHSDITCDYSKTVYQGRHKKVTITCPIHGDFIQETGSHLKGAGCPKCNHQFCQTLFIKEAEQIHHKLYDYSKVIYTKMHDPVQIICKEHGEFTQKPYKHLQGQGCPVCGMRKALGKISSRGETTINLWLTENKYDFIYQYPVSLDVKVKKTNVIVIDFVVNHNGKKYIIEYNGSRHYMYNKFFYPTQQDFIAQLNRDQLLKDYANKNNIELIIFSYKDSDDAIMTKLTNIFNEQAS